LEWGINRSRNSECGLRPIGAYAYAPAGRRKYKAKGIVAEDRGRKSEDRRQRTEGRRRKAEDGRQRTEDRGRKTEDGRQRTEEKPQLLVISCWLWILRGTRSFAETLGGEERCTF
jgi:hypothetical protein